MMGWAKTEFETTELEVERSHKQDIRLVERLITQPAVGQRVNVLQVYGD